MLTLDTVLRIPSNISFSVVGQDAFLLNTQTNQYFGLEKVGARLWELLTEGKTLRDACQTLLSEYQVDQSELERDVLELLELLRKNDLVAIAEG